MDHRSFFFFSGCSTVSEWDILCLDCPGVLVCWVHWLWLLQWRNEGTFIQHRAHICSVGTVNLILPQVPIHLAWERHLGSRDRWQEKACGSSQCPVRSGMDHHIFKVSWLGSRNKEVPRWVSFMRRRSSLVLLITVSLPPSTVPAWNWPSLIWGSRKLRASDNRNQWIS